MHFKRNCRLFSNIKFMLPTSLKDWRKAVLNFLSIRNIVSSLKSDDTLSLKPISSGKIKKFICLIFYLNINEISKPPEKFLMTNLHNNWPKIFNNDWPNYLITNFKYNIWISWTTFHSFIIINIARYTFIVIVTHFVT